jgi:hypothetical protein
MLLVLAFVIMPGASLPSAEPGGPDPTEDEKVLHDAGFTTDANGLLAFFRSRTLTPGDRDRLATRVRELGSNVFAERERASRELSEAGNAALPLLRSAVNSPDLEVARRAERCIEQIERSPAASLFAAAARLTASSRPVGAAGALVAVFPCVEDDWAEEAVLNSLTTVALKNGVADAGVAAAATDGDPLKRAAAGFVLGQASPGQRPAALRLLVDADPRVRFRTASGLLLGGERASVPALIALLDEGPTSLAWRAEELLDQIVGELDLPGATGVDDASRHRARLAWEQWWKANGPRVDLARAGREEADLGLNLITELDKPNGADKGRVRECGVDGRTRWEIRDLTRPIDARLLANGHVLIAEHGQPARVTERRRDGTIVWEYAPPAEPVTCQRLPNGHTFVATYNELVEVDRDKTVVFSFKQPAMMIFCARKLRNGHIIYVSSGDRVVEMDASGKELLSVNIDNAGGWASVESLPNGNFLVAMYGAKKVVEVDRVGNVRWQCDVQAPGHATRLRNGNTLVASIEGRRIVEFDRTGKQVWQETTEGRPFHVYRR